jgi:hypothetical protein
MHGPNTFIIMGIQFSTGRERRVLAEGMKGNALLGTHRLSHMLCKCQEKDHLLRS